MPANDPAKQLAREISNLRREVRSGSRGAQGSFRSLEVDGETVTLPEVVRTSKAARGLADAAMESASGKNSVHFNAAPPDAETGPGTTEGDVWWQINPVTGSIVGGWMWTGDDWAPHTFGDGVLDSLTVAKLLTGQLAVGQRIIAGPADSTHAEVAHDGFRVFRGVLGSGILPEEVIRLGTETNDYLAVVDEEGELVASIDDTGVVTGRVLRSNEEPIIMGKPLTQLIAEEGASQVGFFESTLPFINPDGYYGPIAADTVGIIEANGILVAGRRYRVSFQANWMSQTAGDEAVFAFTYTEGSGETAAAPLVTSAAAGPSVSFTTEHALRWQTATGYVYFTASLTGRHRFLLTATRGNGSGDVYIVSSKAVNLDITDTGPSRPLTGSVSQGGGAFRLAPPPPPPPPTTQQYYVDVAWAGRKTWRGNGSEFPASGTDVYQGYDQFSGNGDMSGMYWFDLPPITGTVDRVDLYTYSRHWYYNSGGTAIINLSDQKGGGQGFPRLRDNWYVGGYPKGGTKVVTLPPDWWALFRGTTTNTNNGRAQAVSFGPGYGTNPTYYGVFTDCRLRIWYTQ